MRELDVDDATVEDSKSCGGVWGWILVDGRGIAMGGVDESKIQNPEGSLMLRRACLLLRGRGAEPIERYSVPK